MAALTVAAQFDEVFDFLADPLRLGRWSLGCFDIAADPETGLHAGTSLYDGSRGWIRVASDRRSGTIDYHVGTPSDLAPRIFCRIAPGGALGYPEETSLVALVAWRGANLSDERWLRLQAAHDAEIWLIKAQVEQEAGKAADRGGRKRL